MEERASAELFRRLVVKRVDLRYAQNDQIINPKSKIRYPKSI